MSLYTSHHPLPSGWDQRPPERGAQAMSYLQFEGFTVTYIGEGVEDSQAASVKANHPVPPDVPLYYFEVQVVDKGDQGYIGVGFCTEDVKMDRLPGWEPHSYGYHGDDGNAFHRSGHGRPYGPKFTSGDVVGALLDGTRRTITFFKNGESLGVAFQDVPEQRLYPMVGLRSHDEKVTGNFGASSFAVDVLALQAHFASQVLASISAVELPVLSISKNSINRWGTSGAAAAVAVQEGVCAAGQLSGSGRAEAGQDDPAAVGQAAEGAGVEAGQSVRAPAKGQQHQQQGDASTACQKCCPLLPGLVFEYLLHHRYWRTAAVVARDLLGAPLTAKQNLQQQEATAAAATPVLQGPGIVQGALGYSSPQAGEDSLYRAPVSEMADGREVVVGSEQRLPPAAGGLSSSQVTDALIRQQLYDDLVAGRLAEVVQTVEQHYGSMFWREHHCLAFKLKVQQFIELVRGGPTLAGPALDFGRMQLGPAVEGATDEELLADALSLLAYADPQESPCGHLLRISHREGLAQELNSSLLAARGAAAEPAAEKLFRQAVVLLEELKRQGDPSVAVIDISRIILKGP